MGFSKDQLPSPGWSGYSLFVILDIFVGNSDSDKAHPVLRDLLRFLLCLTRAPPETLGELFAFFMRFKDSSVFRNNFESWIEDEPGFYSGGDLTKAIQNLFKHNSHSNDLKSLFCSSGSTCGKYLYPLTENAYNNKNFIEGFLDTYLSFVCHLAPTFKEKLEEFHHEASTKFKSCCSSGSCPKIVECPCALPFLYSYGFSFWSPGDLNCVDNDGNSKHGSGGHFEDDKGCTKKSCFEFIIQLERVISGKPFEKLLDAIEAFLWSIRLPFFLFVLAFWALVISYFLYVQLYKLDILHIDSHLHLSRSFKLLPSTLFSDASSKLKDLSYFTL
ncbi:variant erythrocyte surface antigen-1 family protein [Babesia divergens]|uniref:Variant erythrocyte surface antigen-1 family protein n=1 Tax=Babesia divergens TaxID=32595 RepID=A0AAD9G8G6_BABDI|nr:variant erythrocyte surface antigen-1 family protein [Babesia divergens]